MSTFGEPPAAAYVRMVLRRTTVCVHAISDIMPPSLAKIVVRKGAWSRLCGTATPRKWGPTG